MPEINELEREKLDLESQKMKIMREISDKKRRNERASKEYGDLVYIQSRIDEVDKKIAGNAECPPAA